MDSDEDFKHYSSCYYDDDTDRAFYPENVQHQHTKNWFSCDKTVVGTNQPIQCPPQQLILDNTVTSSDKNHNTKSIERWTNNTEIIRNLTCDVDANTQRSVSIWSLLLFMMWDKHYIG